MEEDGLEWGTCEHCGKEHSNSRNSAFCVSCLERRHCCDNCGKFFFEDESNYSCCSSCLELRHICAECGDAYYRVPGSGSCLEGEMSEIGFPASGSFCGDCWNYGHNTIDVPDCEHSDCCDRHPYGCSGCGRNS